MTILIAGDIGGTNTTIRLVELTEDEKAINVSTLFQASYLSQKYDDLVPIIREFLTTTEQKIPSLGCFAIAGPVVNNSCQLTNLQWFLEGDRLAEDLGMEKVILLNDFAAVCQGILALDESELFTLQTGNKNETAPIGVIGAGTGLGESFLIPSEGRYQIFATEGGHTDFAPSNELELKLANYLKSLYDTDHVSVERVVSGQGIVAIYKFLQQENIYQESAEIKELIAQVEKSTSSEEPKFDPAAIIAKAALEKQDQLCQKTMELFVENYGAEAGNLALKLMCYGGLYIAGGIAPKILPLLKDGRFLTTFLDKGRMGNLLSEIPIYIILNTQVGLLGSVLYAMKSK
jgi:glucokinase